MEADKVESHGAVAGQVERSVRPRRGDNAPTFDRDSVTCWKCLQCDRVHALGAYVFAHWDDELTHTCDCGHRHTVLRGVVKYSGA